MSQRPLTDAQIDEAAFREAWIATFGPRRPATAFVTDGTGDRTPIAMGPRRAGWSATGLRGVYPTPEGRWAAKVRVAGSLRYAGTHDTPEAAARAVDALAARLIGYAWAPNLPARSGTHSGGTASGGGEDEDEGQNGKGVGE